MNCVVEVVLLDRSNFQSAEVVLPCADLDSTLRYFLNELNFRVELIFPADAPRVAVVSGFGCRIRLESGAEAGARLRMFCDDDEEKPVSALPDGVAVEFAAADRPVVMPPLDEALIVRKANSNETWGTGRAGMLYRDLIPGRLGGRFIASHIRIPDGGPVPDYVHHHHVRFQMIFCYRGWVKVVYEDQGPPFVMQAGDCVLQPPHIRHQVLECSDAFEVVEIGCPAEHETLVDHEMPLPTESVDANREFSGQRFVFHEAAKSLWAPRRESGLEALDTGIGDATKGEASVAVVRPAGGVPSSRYSHNAEFLFRFVLEGSATLQCNGHDAVKLQATDAFVIPSGMTHSISNVSDDLQWLEVTLPAEFDLVEFS